MLSGFGVVHCEFVLIQNLTWIGSSEILGIIVGLSLQDYKGIEKLDLFGSEDPVANITEVLCTIALQISLKTSPNQENRPKPWYNRHFQLGAFAMQLSIVV